MKPRISVLVSTHNPHEGRLRRTLDALFSQTLDAAQWELVVVDNGSIPPLNGPALGLQRHSHAKLVREDRLGLIHGRIAGIRSSTGELVVFCDDDNVLSPDFLAHAVAIFADDPKLGNASGKILPEFEVTPPTWVAEFSSQLALRDFGDEVRIGRGAAVAQPDLAFGGGSAVFKRAALASFLASIASGKEAKIVGRTGASFDSGEDDHLVLTVIEEGYAFGYFPELVMTHLIPAGRLTRDYLGRLNHGIRRSWMKVLAIHGMCPWKPVARWTLSLRKCRAFLRYRPWAGPAEYVRWRGVCGQFEGLAEITKMVGPLRSVRSPVTLGRLLYLSWHAPLGYLKRCVKEGPIVVLRNPFDRAAMIRATRSLTPLPYPADGAPEVHFLSGAGFWYQTAFCAYSLNIRLTSPLRVVVYDDGTLRPDQSSYLRRLLPGARIESNSRILDRIESCFPEKHFPTICQLRRTYPHIRKLTDIHVGRHGWKLVLDSDMLFYREPTELLAWLTRPARSSIHMRDVENSYGYSANLMQELAGGPIPACVNVGICGLNSDELNWSKIEAWCKLLIRREGLHYLLEQALVAMLGVERELELMPPPRYVVSPSPEETKNPSAVLHHYVASSKYDYYRRSWRSIPRSSEGDPNSSHLLTESTLSPGQ